MKKEEEEEEEEKEKEIEVIKFQKVWEVRWLS